MTSPRPDRQVDGASLQSCPSANLGGAVPCTPDPRAPGRLNARYRFARAASSVAASMSVPIKQANSTLTLDPDDDGTLATFDYRYVPRGGPIGRFTGPLIDKMLTASFTDMLAATEEAAHANG